MVASITRLWRACLIAYALLAAFASAFPNHADAAAEAAPTDFASPTTKNYPTPTIPTDVNPLTTDLSSTVTSGTSTFVSFYNPSAAATAASPLMISGTTLRAASTPTASAAADGEEGQGSRAGTGRSVSVVALVAAIAGLVGVMPL